MRRRQDTRLRRTEFTVHTDFRLTQLLCRICSAHPRHPGRSIPIDCLKERPREHRQAGYWLAAAHWPPKGLLAFNPRSVTRSCVPGHRCIIDGPAVPIMAKKPARASFGLKVGRSVRAVLPPPEKWGSSWLVRRSWRFRRYRSRPRECTCCAGIQLSRSEPISIGL